MEAKIFAGIVLYNPDLARLDENIISIKKQVEKVILIDNNSDNFDEIKQIIKEYNNIYLIKNETNLGIARALNQIVNLADTSNAEWVLTLDQDSVCREELVSVYRKYITYSKAGMLTCHIKDRNFDFEQNDTNDLVTEEVEFCITSGSLLKVSAWKQLGGFDEKLFIDKVDLDICWRLIDSGWKIIRVPYYGILHEIGHCTRRINIGSKYIVVFNHSPMRHYYIVRNGIYCARKHKKKRDTKGLKKSSFHRIIVCMLFEDNKVCKLYQGIKGLIDGYRMPV